MLAARRDGEDTASGEGGEDRAGDIAIEAAVLQLTTAIFDEVGLPSSAGVATSKVVAKVASALAKPRGVMLVPAGIERTVLAPPPVRSFPGIGPVTEAKLHAAGYQTLGAVAEASVEDLQTIFGAWAASISRGVLGLGSGHLGRERPAFAEHDPEGETVGSISNERTFREDVTDPASIEAVLCGLCERGAFEQLPLFDRNERVGAVLDGIRARFGFAAVSLATGRGPPDEERASHAASMHAGAPGSSPRPSSTSPAVSSNKLPRGSKG